MDHRHARTLRGAMAGAVAAGVWAAQSPLDKRAFGCNYDDVELLGKAVTTEPAWLPVGLAMHVANGAVFGAAYSSVARMMPVPPWSRGPLAGISEHLATWPLMGPALRVHPARKQIPDVSRSRRAFWQATWRHFLFGAVLGELERRLNAEEDRSPIPSYEEIVSSNGHGDLERATAGTSPSQG